MTEHTSHTMHENSLTAYERDSQKLGGRELEVYAFLLKAAQPMTDREIAKAMGYKHRSAVQPRISTLVKNGWMVQVDTVSEVDSGVRRPVRRVKAVSFAEREQMTLQLQMA